MTMLYDWCSMVSSGNPDSTRQANPRTFGIGGPGWREVGRWRAAVIRKARLEAPTLRIKPLIHMRGGALKGERYRLDAPLVARVTCPLLGDEEAFIDALREITDAAGESATLYEGEVDLNTDPVAVFTECNRRLVKTGLVDEWIIDASAAKRDPTSIRPRAHPAQVRLWAHIENVCGARVRCEAWPEFHNARLARGGVCVRDNVYARSVQHPHAPAIDPTKPVQSHLLPRAKVQGPAMLVCIDRSRDAIADMRAWSAVSGGECATDLAGWQSLGRSAQDIAAAVQPAASPDLM